MKKLVLGVTLSLGLVIIVTLFTENRFLLELPWVEPGKSNLSDVQNLLGNQYIPEGFIHRDSVFGHSRTYLVHLGSFILASYEIDFFPTYAGEPSEKWMSDTDTSWIWVMSRDTQNELQSYTDHKPATPRL